MKAEPATKMSSEMKELISDCAEQIADSNLDGNEDELLSLKDASTKAEIDENSMGSLCRTRAIPSLKRGKRRYIRLSVVEKMRELMEMHGRNWRKFTEWTVEDSVWEEDQEEEEGQVVVGDDGAVLIPAIKIKERAEELLGLGKYQASAELFSIFTQYYEFK